MSGEKKTQVQQEVHSQFLVAELTRCLSMAVQDIEQEARGHRPLGFSDGGALHSRLELYKKTIARAREAALTDALDKRMAKIPDALWKDAADDNDEKQARRAIAEVIRG